MLERAEKAAEELRWTLRLDGPVSAFEVAKRLGMEIHLDRHLEPRGFTLPSRRAIWLRDGDRAQRTEHACAHEIGHHHIWDMHRGALTERACNRFAAALLLPAVELRDSAAALGLDLPALQGVWRFSSLEAIARRLGEVMPGVISANWVELRPTWREPREPGGELEQLERRALGEVYLKARGMAAAESQYGVARAWRTHAVAPHRALSVLQAG